MGHNARNTSSYFTLSWAPRGLHFFYKYITILYSTSPLLDTLLAVHQNILLLIHPPWVTLLLQVHHHTVLYVISTSPHWIPHHSAGSHFFYNCITIQYSTPLPRVLPLPALPVHPHITPYATSLDHNSFTNISPYCIHNLITHGKTFFATASLYWSLRHCPGWHFFY